jgi:hypothetical protein
MASRDATQVTHHPDEVQKPGQVAMLKTMFVLVVISGQYYPAPVVISQHSTLEKCEQAFKGFTAGIARNTNIPGATTTVMRAYACAKAEIWLPRKGE